MLSESQVHFMSISGSSQSANLEIYSDAQVVAHYAHWSDLGGCERLLFETWLRPGMSSLDFCVGRTTPYLSQRASRYGGVDYCEGMIRLCRSKFPQVEALRLAGSSDRGASKFALQTSPRNARKLPSTEHAVPDAMVRLRRRQRY